MRRFGTWIAAVFFALVLLWVATGPEQADLTLYDADAVLERVGDGHLSPKAGRVFNGDFQRQTFFGAFYVGKSGHFGWAAGRHSLAEAHTEARAYCEQEGPGDCTAYAIVMPANYDPDRPGLTGRQSMSDVRHAKWFHRGRPVVFAMCNSGAWALAGSKDGPALRHIFVRQRAQGLAGDKGRPAKLGEPVCRAYRGTVTRLKG
ncbi:hypothetical protein [uncultured Litoreibacter sp.]|uniref:hypothetical protein n=1 Tax=uncultured Litoreibacter sp. TaxID=1392394 RepID=UPI002631EAC5|nr:hypothetical protein [uncultured Litoreibacter sp.]